MQPDSENYKSAFRSLKLRSGIYLGVGLSTIIASYSFLRGYTSHPWANRWLVGSCLAFVYVYWILWGNLKQNHRPGQAILLSKLGLGNFLSLARGLILALFFGFIFSPRPSGWLGWVPGFLFTLAAIPDYFDGMAARLTNHVTKLGETLDMNIDSLGVFGVSLLAVLYGHVPWWYLPVGLARYIFLAGIWIYERFGRPVYPLPFSYRRRGFAALAMGLFFVILYPPFQPPGTYVAATVFASYILGGFVWDWCITIGWLPPDAGDRLQKMNSVVLNWLPVFLRSLVAVIGIWLVAHNTGVSEENILPYLLMIEIVSLILVTLGIAGRFFSILELIILGIYQATAPLSGLQMVQVFLFVNLLFLGTGKLSVFPVEDWLIYRRIGDPES